MDKTEAGGVGIDDAPDLAVGAIDADLLVLAGALWEALLEVIVEVDEADAASLMPQDARTLFSTLTVSSLNIKES